MPGRAAARATPYRGRAPGSIVRVSYRWWGDGLPPTVGDVLVTAAGTTYLIVEDPAGPRAKARRYLCQKLTGLEEAPDGARVDGLEWDRRDRRR